MSAPFWMVLAALFPFRLLLLLLFLLLCPTACGGGGGSTAGGDDGGAGDAGNGPLVGYSIGGTVSGLEGASVQLALKGGDVVTVGTDGAFRFQKRLASGDDYAVSVVAAPRLHACSAVNSSGKVGSADVTSIVVACPSTDSTLRSLALSDGALSPAFAPGTTAYTALVVGLFDASNMISLTAVPSSPGAHITLDGQPLAAGMKSPPLTFTPLLPVTTHAIVVTAADASSKTTYTIVSADAQEAYVKASNTATNQRFGYGSAIDGDTLVVGAPHESSSATGINGNQADTSATSAGAVYVFVRTGTAWKQQAYIKASNTKANQQFGTAVAIAGNTLVVGAIGEASNAQTINGDQTDTSATGAGAAYVFVRSGTTWTQQAYLKAANAAGSQNFGCAVAISGETIAVGANSEASSANTINGNASLTNAPGSGAAYVFLRSGTTWAQQAYIKPANNKINANFLFASAVSLSGNILAVGAPFENSKATGVNGDGNDTSIPYAGAAYVFVRSGTTWSQQAYVKASNTAANQAFGDSVSVSGGTVAVGSQESSNATGINGNQMDTSAPGAGAVYVFVVQSGSWTQQAYIKASNTKAGQSFENTALDGDILVVGAPGEASEATGINGDQNDTSVAGAGAAYAFQRTGSTWTQVAYIKPSNTGPSQGFGWSPAVSGRTIAISAYGESSNATGLNGDQKNVLAPNAGAVYVFR